MPRVSNHAGHRPGRILRGGSFTKSGYPTFPEIVTFERESVKPWR